MNDANDGMTESSDRAVSPVIGVILMVAITVILAAVIGTFVLGMADDMGDSAPNAQIGASDAANTSPVASDKYANLIVIDHNNGDTLPSGEYTIRIRHSSEDSFTTVTEGNEAGLSWGEDANVSLSSDPGDFSLGDQVKIVLGNDHTGEQEYGGETWDVQILHNPSESMIVDTSVTTH